MLKKYLVDESLFVYLSREKEYSYYSQLIAFLEDAKGKDGHNLYMPYYSKIRLGAFRLYKGLTLMKKISRRDIKVVAPLEKARDRAGYVNVYIKKYLHLPRMIRFSKIFFPKKIINLFIYANDAKSKFIQKKLDRKIEPCELVSLHTCEAAIIANKHNMEIVSFNKDFEYLQKIPGIREIFIKYIHPDEILKDYRNNKNT